VEPPASKHPRFRDGTLTAHRDLRFPALPGMQQPTFVPGGIRADVPAPYATMPFLVPTVDADGNEIAGIRLPVLAVPMATLTGWQFRSEQIGASGTLIAMAGAYIPFPATKAERERRKDPRVSIAERYASKTEYLNKVRQVASDLANDRFVLREDVQPLVDEAAAHWDLATGAIPRSTNQSAR
jgi:hypothetical protein